MTETPECRTPEHADEVTTEALRTPPSANSPANRLRLRIGRRRVYRIAAAAVTLAATVVVMAAIFWSGFIMGTHAGGHHGHGAGSMYGAATMHHGHGSHGGGQGGQPN